jgi:hypothetical protein
MTLPLALHAVGVLWRFVRPFFFIVSLIFDHACMFVHYNVLFKIELYEGHPIEKKSYY